MIKEDYCWETAEGPVNSTQFIDLLTVAFPEATTIYLEATSIENEVENVFKNYIQEGPYLPESQTLWPKSYIKNYRCEFSEEFLKKLSELTQNYAEPELFDHIFIYQNETSLLKWPDAFSNCIWISKEITENRVKKFADKLGLPYKKVYVNE